jgi:hypothetical protein
MAPVTEADLGAVERWFAATLEQCQKLRSCQRHVAAENSAAGALRLLRTMRETEAVHGFFSGLLVIPAEEAFQEFIREAA